MTAKEMFDAYCENKIRKDETMFVDGVEYSVVGHGNIRGEEARILFDEDAMDVLAWVADDAIPDGNTVNRTTMEDCFSYFAKMEFDWISDFMYYLIDDEWEDWFMDELIEQ